MSGRDALPTLRTGTETLAQRVAQRRRLAADLRSERRGSPRGSMTATSPRARADSPPGNGAGPSKPTVVVSPSSAFASLGPCEACPTLPGTPSNGCSCASRAPSPCEGASPKGRSSGPESSARQTPRWPARSGRSAPLQPRPPSPSRRRLFSAREPESSTGRPAGAPSELQTLAALFWAGVSCMVQGREGEGPAEDRGH